MISRRFEEAAARWAKHPAIRTPAAEISYEELNREANRIAYALLAQGEIDRSLPVGLLCDGYARTAAAVFGVWKAGRMLVVLDPLQPPARLRKIAEHARCREIVSGGGRLQAARSLAPRLLIDQDGLPTLGDDNPRRTTESRRPLAVVYTSGSTGTPKGVVHDHDSLTSACDHWIDGFAFAPGDRALFVGNTSSIAGFNDLLKYSLSGVTTTPFDIRESGIGEALRTMQEQRTTLLHSVPSVFRAMAGALRNDEPVKELRLLHLGGEPLFRSDVELFRRHFPRACKLVNNLGSTEVPTSMQFVVEPAMQIVSTLVPVGREIAGKRTRVVDGEGRDVKPGEVGILHLSGRTLARGYHREPELTASCFSGDLDGSGDNWRSFRSGDLARIDDDGQLTIIGRADDQLKIRGHRVELAEVELALRESVDDATRELTVVAREGERREGDVSEKRIVAYLVAREGATIDLEALRRKLAARLPAPALPGDYVVLDRIPRTGTGKVDRAALPAPASSVPRADLRRRSRIATELELLWCQLLGRRSIAADDDFFDLGGDSLKALELALEIGRLFGRAPTLPEMVQAPTLAKMAAWIESRPDRQPQPSLVRFKSDGHKTPLHVIHGMGGGVVIFRELARRLDRQRPVFAYQARGIDGITRPLRSIDAMATLYLEELRAVQPHGPYLLAGYSMGGTVAFEMARRLREAGEAIEALIPIDSGAPLRLGWRERWRHQLVISRIVVRHLVRQPPEFTGRNEYTVAIGKLPLIHFRALRRYRPRRFDGSMDLISSYGLAERLPDGNRDRPIAEQLERHHGLKRELWRELLGGELRIHRVRGEHLDLLRPPALEGLLGSLRSILDRN